MAYPLKAVAAYLNNVDRRRARNKGGGVPVTAIRQRDGAVIRDRAGNTIQVRS